ncbi:MAG: dTDP-4-dehydrorhamnose reductase [Phormidesmis sp.]
MSILLVGAGGQVGQELRKTLGALVPAVGPITAIARQQLDLSDLAAIATTVNAAQPKLIVNAAAYTAVDKAESEPELAYRINAEAPQILAESAAKCGAKLVHISTDYVFAGEAGSPRCESDPTGPLNVYGESKLAGEIAIREALDEHIILRTAWIYGTHGKGNFLKTMLRLGKEREVLTVVADQVGSPTWARDIAEVISQLSGRLMTQHSDQTAAVAGTYHFTNSGVASWYDFAIAIFQEAKALGIPLTVHTVNPIATADYPTPAKRPLYSVLNCQKLSQCLRGPAPHWRESLQKMLKEFVHSDFVG